MTKCHWFCSIAIWIGGRENFIVVKMGSIAIRKDWVKIDNLNFSYFSFVIVLGNFCVICLSLTLTANCQFIVLCISVLSKQHVFLTCFWQILFLVLLLHSSFRIWGRAFVHDFLFNPRGGTTEDLGNIWNLFFL